ncbi:MAG: SulP family inorganic anion transporter [Flavobacteriaceae bacterium]|nr:SulP family inorganic anion transporter [Flavobacteriaceae bacterium]
MFEIHFNKVATFKNDILSGLTVALALVPEAVAFAFVAGVDPLVGLYAAFMVGLITACIGGRPGMISGATGALAVVMVSLVADHGVEYLFITVVLMGILQITAGVLKLGKFIRMVPYPVMLGFVNGLAIVIFLAQLGQFGQPGEPGWLTGTFMEGSIVDVAWLQGQELYMLVSLVLVTMIIIHSLPRFTKAIPSSLVAIAVVTGLVLGLDLNTKVVGDVASISGGLPSFHIPVVPFTMETFWIVLPYAIILAAIGLIESLLTLRLIDEITETRGRGNRECIGQGLANTVTGFFGGMGGCAMIGQSIINIKSGGRGRLSGITAALALLGFILFGASYIEQVPIAALVGVMFMVVFGTFAWSSFQVWNKVPKSDVIVIVLVTALTVIFDLAIAVLAGVVVSSLVFAWENAKRIRARKHTDDHGVKHYEIYGPLFFGSIELFNSKFDVQNDPYEVVIDFKESRIMDQSAIACVNKLTERYLKKGKNIHLRHLSSDCVKLIEKAEKICDVNVLEDPDYFVAIDNFRRAQTDLAKA